MVEGVLFHRQLLGGFRSQLPQLPLGGAEDRLVFIETAIIYALLVVILIIFVL